MVSSLFAPVKELILKLSTGKRFRLWGCALVVMITFTYNVNMGCICSSVNGGYGGLAFLALKANGIFTKAIIKTLCFVCGHLEHPFSILHLPPCFQFRLTS